MRCAKCGKPLRCIRCGTAAPDDDHSCSGSRALTGSIHEELHKRCVIVEVSKGVMRHVVLLSDVEELLGRMTP